MTRFKTGALPMTPTIRMSLSQNLVRIKLQQICQTTGESFLIADDQNILPCSNPWSPRIHFAGSKQKHQRCVGEDAASHRLFCTFWGSLSQLSTWTLQPIMTLIHRGDTSQLVCPWVNHTSQLLSPLVENAPVLLDH